MLKLKALNSLKTAIYKMILMSTSIILPISLLADIAVFSSIRFIDSEICF